MKSEFNASTTADEVLESLDLKNKVIIITGVTSGLGAESARALAARGAYIIGLSRTTQHHTDFAIRCDLADLTQIREAIKKILQLGKKIDGIMCNAGIMSLPKLQQVAGFEKQFFVNYLSHFILVTELLDALTEDARIVVLSSEGHRLARDLTIEFDNLTGERNYKAWRAYGQSKLANLLFVKALAERFKNSKKIAIAVHPGMITTQLNRYLPLWQRIILFPIERFFTKSIASGAATQVFAVAHPDAARMNGGYLSHCRIKTISKKITRNPQIVEQLWETSMTIKKKLGF